MSKSERKILSTFVFENQEEKVCSRVREQDIHRSHDKLRPYVFKELIIWAFSGLNRLFFVSTDIGEQLLCSMFSSILSYIFELIFGSFRVFGA